MSTNDAGSSTTLGDLDRETADLPLTARKLGGRYRVIRELGRGGMGSVYEVLSDDGRRLAAKLIALERSEHATALERFFREARAAQSIESPHVVRTLELGLDDASGSPFIVMELLDGFDLRFVVDERAPLASEAVARIGEQAARGLAAAHDAGVVHRDVKPSNVFLQRRGNSLTVKVCDFGIAKQVEEQPGADLTHSGGILGSPRYMSPEQAKSARRVDARSDVWSLCATLYAVASGRELWTDRSSLGELIVAICTEPIEPLSKVAPWIDPELARTIERGLERDPERRWQSMRELGARLAKSAGEPRELDESDLTRVEPSLRRTRSWRGPVVAAVVVSGGIAMLLFASTRRDAPSSPATSAPSAVPVAAEPPAAPALAPASAPEPAPAPPPSVASPRPRTLAPRSIPSLAAPPGSATKAYAQPSAAPSPLAPKDDW